MSPRGSPKGRSCAWAVRRTRRRRGPCPGRRRSSSSAPTRPSARATPTPTAPCSPEGEWIAERCGRRLAEPRRKKRIQEDIEEEHREARAAIAACHDLIDFERAKLLGTQGGQLRKKKPKRCGGMHLHHWVRAYYQSDESVVEVDVAEPAHLTSDPELWLIDDAGGCRPAPPAERAALARALDEALRAGDAEAYERLLSPGRVSLHCPESGRRVRQEWARIRGDDPKAIAQITSCAEALAHTPADYTLSVAHQEGSTRAAWRLLGLPRCETATDQEPADE